MRIPASLHRIRRDERAATLIEFAFVAPVLCILLLGAFDVGHTLYMTSVLQGVVQKAARDSGLETSTETST
ncbi:MAG: TadE/TadG family type IV pilus assembly protein, partial [Sphingobium sp.]